MSKSSNVAAIITGKAGFCLILWSFLVSLHQVLQQSAVTQKAWGWQVSIRWIGTLVVYTSLCTTLVRACSNSQWKRTINERFELITRVFVAAVSREFYIFNIGMRQGVKYDTLLSLVAGILPSSWELQRLLSQHHAAELMGMMACSHLMLLISLIAMIFWSIICREFVRKLHPFTLLVR